MQYKSGKEIQFIHRQVSSPGPVNIRVKFEDFLKTGKQDVWTFHFRDRPNGDPVVNNNIQFTVDFKDLSSVVETEEK
ncbi:hypothetical protein PCA10_24610 [Metapseudomonas resinovorans NBRC 106553]|uniref:Uncharacterized protein n=1 Tax=Metapseudomonas resinovorans NBRC 106553 TaxID=1245471 RepID=S6AQW7_METRE|nr:hypothetical protein PCA10_24610 [Pseudomonas resinovorans NBRC 106553]